MRKRILFTCFLFVLLGKLAFAGTSVQSLFQPNDPTPAVYKSEVTTYYQQSGFEFAVEMEDDLSGKTKKHLLSPCDIPSNCFSYRSPSFACEGISLSSLHEPATADLVILHCRILI